MRHQRRYSVVVITLDFDSNDPGSTPGTAFCLNLFTKLTLLFKINLLATVFSK